MPYLKRYEDTLYNPEWLRRVYVDEDRNAAQVAALIGATKGAVLDALRRRGIPVKDASEAQRLAPHKGSSSPRPRGKFKATLHNAEWMATRVHLNASELAREAGCSVPSAQDAMRRYGRTPPTSSDAMAGRAHLKRRKSDGDVRRVTAHRRAREACPDGACVICGGEGEHVNHIDRNWQNNEVRNLERLCSPCHRRQHACEAIVMIEMLAAHGIAYQKVWIDARARILDGSFGPTRQSAGRLVVDGVTRSVGEWSRISGIAEHTIRGRMMRGWDPARTVSEKPSPPPLYTVDGITAALPKHAKRMGLPIMNVYSRISQGWTIERALTTPIRERQE